MDRSFLMAIVIAFLLVLLALMVLGWQLRKRRQRGVVAPQPVPADLGQVYGSFAGKYVATTKAGDPLDRLAVHGLGFRGPVQATVTSGGLELDLVGARDVWIPHGDVFDIRHATWTIDRVVEKDGLNLIEWVLGDLVVETYLRMDDATAFDAALAHLTPERRSL